MGLDSGTEVADRLATYLGELTNGSRHADGRTAAGLLLWAARTEGRRSVEPIAWVTESRRTFKCSIKSSCTSSPTPRGRMRQMLAKVREQVVPKMTRRRPDREPGSSTIRRFPSKAGIGRLRWHHQYCGQLGQAGQLAK